MKKQLLLGAIAFGLSPFAMAGSVGIDYDNVGIDAGPVSSSPWSGTLSVGTTGISVGAAYQESPHWSTSASMGGFYIDPTLSAGGETYGMGIRLLSGMLTENWRPWAGSGFFLSTGLLFNGNRLSLRPRTVTGNYAFATPATATFHPVDPFLGLGWDHPFAGGRWTFHALVGAAWQGRTAIDVQMGTDPYALQAHQSEKTSLQTALGWRWLPVMQIGVRYHF
ncbi:hypothetical protein AB4090_02365 [Acidithiobacillus sp. IBUN Pt1247-S3]|uniref:hypothetical protein n=1 Tax=Acidithiobacillus sp. IBUN Pt1247-S3 TaxID=3166642 RepID=UPI0034E3A865